MISYIKNRLREKSTWAGIGVIVTGAAAIDAPYSWIVIAVGVIGILAPTSQGGESS